MEINPLKSPFAQAYRVSRPSLSATLPRFKAEFGINGAPYGLPPIYSVSALSRLRFALKPSPSFAVDSCSLVPRSQESPAKPSAAQTSNSQCVLAKTTSTRLNHEKVAGFDSTTTGWFSTDRRHETKETLSTMAKRLLPPLTYYTDDELEQVGRFYLWNILSQYAKRNVAIVTTAYRTGESVGIDGLNDSQKDQIMEWFGWQSNWQGGLILPIQNVFIALSMWNVEWRKESSVSGPFANVFD
jgi:hypothetical protein